MELIKPACSVQNPGWIPQRMSLLELSQGCGQENKVSFFQTFSLIAAASRFLS